MRMVYPDWKHTIEVMLDMQFPWQDNEMLWAVYDRGFDCDQAVVQIAAIAQLPVGIVRKGYQQELFAVQWESGRVIRKI